MDRRFFLKSMAGVGLLSLASGLGPSTAWGADPVAAGGEAGSREGDYTWLEGALEGFSATLIKEHLVLFARYRAELKKLEDQDKNLDLGGANPVRSPWRTHMLHLMELQNAVRLHHCYFSCLTPKNLSPGTIFLESIQAGFGSFDQWWVRFRATSLAARAWGALGWDLRTGRPIVFGTDDDIQWPVYVQPVLVVDMAEHAYCLDYPGDPYRYLNAWLKRIDWERVDQILKEVQSSGQ